VGGHSAFGGHIQVPHCVTWAVVAVARLVVGFHVRFAPVAVASRDGVCDEVKGLAVQCFLQEICAPQCLVEDVGAAVLVAVPLVKELGLAMIGDGQRVKALRREAAILVRRRRWGPR